MTTFQQRALTATIFTAIMLVGMFLHEGTFILLFFIISMGCLWEYMKLMTDDNRLREIGALIIGNSLWFGFIFKDFVYTRTGSLDLNHAIGGSPNITVYSILLFGFMSFLIIPFLLLIIELFQKTDKPFQNVAGTLLGIFYAIVPIFLLIGVSKETVYTDGIISGTKFTPNIAAGILFLTWINDTGAYLVGSRIGKTPLLPRISPKKTWEGTIGGIVFCILSGFLIHRLLGVLSLTDWLVIGGLVSVFGTLGDLIESMLKRSVGVKDSGTFMPGHGGFLDRFDAFIFEIPFIFLYLMIR
jgi:phosphatidate cytidylyltransferase